MQPAPGVAAKSDWIDLDNSTSSFADNETTECYDRTASCSALQPARRLPSDRIATPHRPHGGRLGPAAGLWLLVMRHRCAAAAEVVDDSLSYAVGVILRYLVSSTAVPKHNRPGGAVAVYRLGILLDRLRDCCYPSPNLGCVLDALRSQLLRKFVQPRVLRAQGREGVSAAHRGSARAERCALRTGGQQGLSVAHARCAGRP